MIDKIGVSSTGSLYSSDTRKSESTSKSEKSGFAADAVTIGSSTVSAGIYSKSTNVIYDRATIDKLKQDAEDAKENLRAYVADLLINQGKAQSMTPDTDTVTQAKQAISEDGEWGVKAVSDRIVEFAKAICGNDTSKLGILKAAIEKGFDEVRGAFNGSLPDICNQTHDEIMRKLDAWAADNGAGQSA